MRAILQRVSSASVSIDGILTGKIQKGLVLLLGIGIEDKPKDVEYVIDKCVQIRIFSDENGKMNLSVQDVNGEILVISQFTLYGSTRKGRRPSFNRAASPQQAKPLYQLAVERLRQHNIHVVTGSFGADMEISLVNCGPVTLTIDSES